MKGKLLLSTGIFAAGVVALGLSASNSAYATTSANVSINVNVLATLGLTVDSEDTTSLPINSYGELSSVAHVTSNSYTGYTLSVRAAEHPAFVSEHNTTIPAGVLTSATGGQGLWSYKTNADVTDWTAMTLIDHPIRVTTSYESFNEDTEITYGISTSNQATGTYQTSLIYTLSANDPEEGGGEFIVDPFAECGDSCTVEGVEFARQADNKLWATTSTTTSTEPGDIATVCPAGSSLPTAQDYYDLILAYGGTPDSSNPPYGVENTGSAAAQLLSDTGWNSGWYWTSTTTASGDYWVAWLTNNYSGMDHVFTGVLPARAACVAS